MYGTVNCMIRPHSELVIVMRPWVAALSLIVAISEASIDYELFPAPFDPNEILYFHAHWRRENPTNGWAPNAMQTNNLETQVPNLNGDGYTILETTGSGSFFGCNHSALHHQGTWWGEGDDISSLTMTPGLRACTVQAARTTLAKAGACRRTRTHSAGLLYTKKMYQAVRPHIDGIWPILLDLTRRSRSSLSMDTQIISEMTGQQPPIGIKLCWAPICEYSQLRKDHQIDPESSQFQNCPLLEL